MLLKFFRKFQKKNETTLTKTCKTGNIRLLQGDITKEAKDFDAIVNAANETLLGGGGVDGAIHRAAGPKLFAECMTLNGCDTGKSKVTDAYNIPCKKIIHTVGPIYDVNHKEDCQRLLASAYRSCMDNAKECGMKSVLFPSVSTGVYGYPVEDAAKVALTEAMDFLSYNPEMELAWVLFSEDDFNTYNKVLHQLSDAN